MKNENEYIFLCDECKKKIDDVKKREILQKCEKYYCYHFYEKKYLGRKK
jgi:hypothetical protein